MALPEIKLEEGLKGVAQIVVDEEHLATEFIQPTVESLGTPALINLMNLAAFNAVKDHLPEGFTTVCTYVNVRHLAATPVGMSVTAEAILEKAEGYKLTIKVSAYDEVEKVGEGIVERYIVDRERFMKKVKERKKELLGGGLY